MKQRNFYIISIGLLFCFSTYAQNEVDLLSNWDYKRKPAVYEKINSVIATTNGYIAAVGETTGTDYKDVVGLFILINAADGSTVQWKKVGRFGNQSLKAIVQNPDGTFTALGHKENSKGDLDPWLVVLGMDGDAISEETAGESGIDDVFVGASINTAGTLMALGRRGSDGDEVGSFLVRRGIDGISKRVMSSKGLVNAKAIASIADESFVIAGLVGSRAGQHTDQVWASRIDDEGNELWDDLQYYGAKIEKADLGVSKSITDGGFVIAGTTTGKGYGQADMWVAKIQEDGQLSWEKTYGGPADDIATSIVALSHGGYGILGHTKSHLVRTKYSRMRLFVIDEEGVEKEKDLYTIYDAANRDQGGVGIIESLVDTDIILIGRSAATKSEPSLPFLGAVTYKMARELSREEDGEPDTYGSASDLNLSLSKVAFVDANKNKYLEQNERGYISLDVTNDGRTTAGHLKIAVEANGESDIAYWQEVYVGTLLAGQTRRVNVPVQANRALRKSSYPLTINLESGGLGLATTETRVPSNRPEPANLLVNSFHFTPGSDSKPGQPIALTVEFVNVGGLASEEFLGDFTLPVGVQSLNSERFSIPALSSDESHAVTFSFSYPEGFQEPSIRVAMSTQANPKMLGPKRSFDFALPNRKEVVHAAPVANDGLDIIWTSHELNEYRTVDVTTREINIKAVAVANHELSRKNFAVLVNGRRSQGQKLDESVLTPPENHQQGRMQQYYTDKLILDKGENKIQIVYLDDEGKEMIGRSPVLTFNYETKNKPNLYVLSIGVKHDDLDYTVNDAKAIASMYQKLRGVKSDGPFKKVEVWELTTAENTTSNNIKKAFLDLSKDKTIKDNDLVVVFISSHGKVVDGDKYVLLPSDYNPLYEEIYTIDFNEDILKRLRTVDGNKLLFIDACHSGSAGGRSYSNAAASKMVNDLITATAGMEIFASCGDREFSYEDPEWGNGAFTKSIIEAFNNEIVEVDGKKICADISMEVNGRKDKGSDGVITIEELKSFIQQRVPYLVKTVKKKAQNPVNKSTELLPGEMGIYLVNK